MRSFVLVISAMFFISSVGAWAAPITLKEAEVTAGVWGYQPEDQAVLQLNPPAFTWAPVKSAESYTLQVAKDADFSTLICEVKEEPWTSHCPSECFSEGAFFWRYRAHLRRDKLTTWSTVRKGEIAPDAAPFPKPDSATLVKRIPEGHPRLFFQPDEIDALKTLSQGDLAERWKGLEKKAEALLANPPDTSEPPLYPEGTKYKGPEWKKIWWGNRVRAQKVADGAALLAFVYRLSGEERYGQGAHDLMMALCDWDPKGSTQYNYNDEAAMPLLYYPSRVYTWAYDTFSAAERARIVAMMRVRGADCFNHLRKRNHLWRPYASHSNRAWHWLGEVATAFMGEIPEAEEWLDYSMTIFFTCYPVWGDEDGGWHEGMAYWSSYLQRFMYWAVIMQNTFDIDPFQKPFFKETGYYGLYTLPSKAKAAGFGDHATNSSAQRIAGLMRLLAAGAQNPYWQWYADENGGGAGGYFGFITAARSQALTASSPSDLPTSRVFRGAGLAVLNSNLLDGAKNTQVHFKSSPMGRQSHGYNANNAFLLYLKGEPALIRSGHRDVYGSPHHSKWMWETKSDNAILVNGQGQPPHSMKATGALGAFHTSDWLDVVVGEAGASYENLDRWTRRILFFKPHAVLIHDLLEAPEASDFQWLLHAKGPFELGEQAAQWSGKNGKLAIDFLHPQALTLTQTDQFDPPPHEWSNLKLNESHLTAATTDKVKQQEFVTLISIDDAAVTATLDKQEVGATLNISLPDKEVEVTLKRDNFSLKAGEESLEF